MQQSSFYESMKYKILSKIVLYNSTQISAIYCKYASTLAYREMVMLTNTRIHKYKIQIYEYTKTKYVLYV